MLMSSTDRIVRHLFCICVTSEQRNTDPYIIHALIRTGAMYILSCTAAPLYIVRTISRFLTQCSSNFGSHPVFTGSPLAFFLVSSRAIFLNTPGLATNGKVATHFKVNGWSTTARQTWQTCYTVYQSTAYTRQVSFSSLNYCKISHY